MGTEYTDVEKPFLDQLAALGWTVIDHAIGGSTEIPTDPTISLRTGFLQVVLRDVFFTSIRDLNRTDDGQPWLTDQQLEDILEDLYRHPSRNLVEANEGVLAKLLRIQVDVNELTGEEYPNVTLIDFHHPERNAFHAINQFRVDTPGRTKEMIIPDIVLFVNGLPVGVIECKRPDANSAKPMFEAFEQLMRYSGQRPETVAAGLKEGEPKLFFTNQVLIRTMGDEAEFGTITSTDEEFFYPWRSIFEEAHREYTPPLGRERAQEILIQGMLPKSTFLDLIRTCVVFKDAGKKRIKIFARHQQYRAMRKIIDRLREGASPEARSGVIWHTQGSGKSLTMVFVIRKLRMLDDLKDYKVCMVCDRVDLESQLAETAELTGETVTRIASADMMRRKLATDTSNLNMVMVHKFLGDADESAPDYVPKEIRLRRFKQIGTVNASPRILLMIDEAHRSQGSDLGDNLVEAFPEATRLAFTGTPLIVTPEESKRTVKRFGDYIDTYALLDAVDDGATVKIVYEGKTADAAVDHKHEFNTEFEDLARRHVEAQLRRESNQQKLKAIAKKEQTPLDDLIRKHTDAEILALKRKWGTTGDLLEADARIEEIARDLVNHYIDQILPNRFKAQVVVSSQVAAVKYRRFIEQALAERLDHEQAKPVWEGDPLVMSEDDQQAHQDQDLIQRIEFLKVAVVISGMGTNESAAITTERKRARQMDAVKNFRKAFNQDDPEQANTGIAFLVVCDMLLTGFDAPIEQVMYIDKKIKHHNLLQTIARVNRVAKGKSRGYIVDYIGLANHLKEALSIYARDDQEAIESGLSEVADEIPHLETRYKRLLQLFIDHNVDGIREFVEQRTNPRDDYDILEAAITAMEDLRARAEFEVRFKRFLMSLDVVLPSPGANPYKVPAKRFGLVLAHVRQRYKDDTLSISGMGGKVKRLIDEHLISLGINPQIPPVELLSETFIKELGKHTSTRAKASEMEHAIRKHAKVHFNEDPEFYKSISDRLEAAIQQHKDDWERLVAELDTIRESAKEGRKDSIEGLGRKAAPFYANIRHMVYDENPIPDEDQPRLKQLTAEIVVLLADRLQIVSFWSNKALVKDLRGRLSELILGSGIDAAVDSSGKLVTEIAKLARERHKDLVS